MSTRLAQRRAERGASLLEVLVAIVVLAIGMMGVVALQASSLRYAQGGWARSAAAAGIADLAERIRSNPSMVAADFKLDADYTAQRGAVRDLSPATDCDSAVCTPAQTSAFHLARWRQSLDAALPGGAGFIEPMATGGTPSRFAFGVTILWHDKGFVDTAGSPQTAPSCTGDEADVSARSCCPAAADAPAGVRCTRVILWP